MSAADERLEAYARLAVRVGLNLQPGQTLGINALIEHAPLARAITREAYAAGARYVDVLYSDQHVRRAHIERADDEKLGYSPPWLVRRLRELGEIGGALCAITGYAASCVSSNGGAGGSTSSPGGPVIIDGLTNGRFYTCTVTATSALGTSVPSPASNGALPSSASPMSNGSGRLSARQFGSTSPIRSPPGASTSTACSSARSP